MSTNDKIAILKRFKLASLPNIENVSLDEIIPLNNLLNMTKYFNPSSEDIEKIVSSFRQLTKDPDNINMIFYIIKQFPISSASGRIFELELRTQRDTRPSLK